MKREGKGGAERSLESPSRPEGAKVGGFANWLGVRRNPGRQIEGRIQQSAKDSGHNPRGPQASWTIRYNSAGEVGKEYRGHDTGLIRTISCPPILKISRIALTRPDRAPSC